MSDVTYLAGGVTSRQTIDMAAGRNKVAAVFGERPLGGWLLFAVGSKRERFIDAVLTTDAVDWSTLPRAANQG